jgi:hypothetical protein
LHLRWSFGLILLASAVFAQTLDRDTQLLVDHLDADKDIFGAGSPSRLQLGRSLEDQVRKGYLSWVVFEDEMLPDFADPKLAGTEKAAEMFLETSFAYSDIVVVVDLKKQLSIFNTNKTEVVTDSLFRIRDILYNKRKFDLRPGDKIVVTRLGGSVNVDNRVVEVHIDGFPTFDVGGNYLLFLHKTEISGSYEIGRYDAFVIDGTSIYPLAKLKFHPAAPFLTSSSSFFEKIRSVAVMR